MRIIIAIAVVAALLLPTAPIALADLPTFCTKPTKKQKRNKALMRECRILKETDDMVGDIRKGIDGIEKSLGATGESLKKMNKGLEQRKKKPRPFFVPDPYYGY